MTKPSKRAAVKLTGPQAKFCAAYAVDQNGTAAYRAAYPNSSSPAARVGATRLLAKDNIQAEIARIRAAAESLPGSAVLTLAEKRNKLAAVVRAKKAELDGCEIRIADKLAAIKLDNDLAGEGSEAEANDALTGLLERVMK